MCVCVCVLYDVVRAGKKKGGQRTLWAPWGRRPNVQEPLVLSLSSSSSSSSSFYLSHISSADSTNQHTQRWGYKNTCTKEKKKKGERKNIKKIFLNHHKTWRRRGLLWRRKNMFQPLAACCCCCCCHQTIFLILEKLRFFSFVYKNLLRLDSTSTKKKKKKKRSTNGMEFGKCYSFSTSSDAAAAFLSRGIGLVKIEL